jgi:hypothetical protein
MMSLFVTSARTSETLSIRHARRADRFVAPLYADVSGLFGAHCQAVIVTADVVFLNQSGQIWNRVKLEPIAARPAEDNSEPTACSGDLRMISDALHCTTARAGS